MRKINHVKRDAMATADGFTDWERSCGYVSPKQASAALHVALRTYCRWKAAGLPKHTESSRIMREIILDRMEEVLARKKQR